MYILSAHDKKCIDYVGRKAMEVKCLQWDHRTETESEKQKPKIQRRLQKDCFRIWNRKSIKLRRHLCVFGKFCVNIVRLVSLRPIINGLIDSTKTSQQKSLRLWQDLHLWQWFMYSVSVQHICRDVL